MASTSDSDKKCASGPIGDQYGDLPILIGFSSQILPCSSEMRRKSEKRLFRNAPPMAVCARNDAMRRRASMLQKEALMPMVDTSKLDVIERLPGWNGRYFHSQNLTFAHYDFKRGSSIHEHFHPQEEVYEVIEGEVEMTIDGKVQIARPGMVAMVPSNVPHSVKALTDGRVIIVDYPLRPDFG